MFFNWILLLFAADSLQSRTTIKLFVLGRFNSLQTSRALPQSDSTEQAAGLCHPISSGSRDRHGVLAVIFEGPSGHRQFPTTLFLLEETGKSAQGRTTSRHAAEQTLHNLSAWPAKSLGLCSHWTRLHLADGTGLSEDRSDVRDDIVAWTLQFHQVVGRSAQRRNHRWLSDMKVAGQRGQWSQLDQRICIHIMIGHRQDRQMTFQPALGAGILYLCALLLVGQK
jgi:hypothetical protein